MNALNRQALRAHADHPTNRSNDSRPGDQDRRPKADSASCDQPRCVPSPARHRRAFRRRDYPRRCNAELLDVTNVAAIHDVAERNVSRHRRIDVVAGNAGDGSPQPCGAAKAPAVEGRLHWLRGSGARSPVGA
jgi:NAD(P)-dependent dehydrogenase (short-subunit alcohol dehydrogenase family)